MRVFVVVFAASLAALPLFTSAQDAAAPAPAPAAAPAPPPPSPWKAQARAGYVATGGNAVTTTLTGGANVSWSDRANKVSLEGVGAYGEAGTRFVSDRNGDGLFDAGDRVERHYAESVNNWMVKGRYDRFLTATQGLFVAAYDGQDMIAGKKVIGGGQAGYAMKLLKTPGQELIAELGYDFTHEEYTAAGARAVQIHSGRAFLGETLKLSETAGLVASVEALANLNEEDALSSRNPTRKVRAWEDVRVNGKIALNAALRSNVSLSVGYTVKWDRAPAQLPAVDGAPPLAPGYVPFADKTDTITDVALIVTFL